LVSEKDFVAVQNPHRAHTGGRLHSSICANRVDLLQRPRTRSGRALVSRTARLPLPPRPQHRSLSSRGQASAALLP
jgi:hypothetical protein